MSASLIRALNDQLRAWPFAPNGQLIVTEGVAALPTDDMVAVLRMVRTYATFSPDNDPHGEHDFGSFEHAGIRYFWKIDYYDQKLEFHSPDPSDSTVTRRVLTVMQASEY